MQARPNFVERFGLSVMFVLAGAVIAAGLTAVPALAQQADLEAWPREISSGAVTVRVYEPEFDELTSDRLSARAAAAVIG
jgi:ABC-type molybdate transport system permease subunit